MVNTSQKKYDFIIIGLGKTGMSCAEYLSKKNISFAVVDDRSDPPFLSEMQNIFPKHDLFLGEFDEDILLQAKEIVISPGVSLQEPAIQLALNNNISVISDVELFIRNVTKPIIAVTGSNGKSTVVSMLSYVLNATGLNVKLGGNIGTPALELLNGDDADLYVLELSSFQLEAIYSLNAEAAVVLNISEDHMDRYSSLSEYAEAKSRVYQGDGLMVLNREDPLVMKSLISDRKYITFGVGQADTGHYGMVPHGERISLVHGEQHLLFLDEMKLKGQHNGLNALAVFALADSISIDKKDVVKLIKDYPGLTHRCQWVDNIKNVDWYNDSKGTNVGATLSAIDGLTTRKNIILIAGGIGKGADFTPLKNVVDKIKLCIVFGQDGQQIAEALSSYTEINMAADLEDAVIIAANSSEDKDIVLFSPACASFDMFKNFEERGNAFVKLVQRVREGDL